jgi:hypothetical protein
MTKINNYSGYERLNPQYLNTTRKELIDVLDNTEKHGDKTALAIVARAIDFSPALVSEIVQDKLKHQQGDPLTKSDEKYLNNLAKILNSKNVKNFFVNNDKMENLKLFLTSLIMEPNGGFGRDTQAEYTASND